ncbi:MAG TPA: chorismate mutase [Gaiellaceae bacterium]|nr:chorismate mutase [Gaiellaceae bacterium]
MSTTQDSFVTAARDEIAALDVRLIATINARIRKVAELAEYKQDHGIAFVDPDREAWLVGYLKRVNGGPLSDEGVEELITYVLDLVKREVNR